MRDAIEAAAEAIFELNPAPYSWTTWEERLKLETENRGDKSWSGPVERSREHGTAALSAALPHLTEGLAEVTKSVLDRRPYSDATRSEIRGLEHAIARAVTEHLERRITDAG